MAMIIARLSIVMAPFGIQPSSMGKCFRTSDKSKSEKYP
jgi:hypothetical protein